MDEPCPAPLPQTITQPKNTIPQPTIPQPTISQPTISNSQTTIPQPQPTIHQPTIHQPTAPQPPVHQNHKDLLLRLLKIAEQFNMDQKDLPALLIKTVVLSLKYIDRRALFVSLFPDHYADWDLLGRSPPGSNPLGDAEPWLTLLSLLDWPGLAEKDLPPPLIQIKATLKAHSLDQPPGCTMACRALIIQMVQGLQSMHAIEQLTSRALCRCTRDGTVHFLATLCDAKHTQEAYLTTLALILSAAHLRVHAQSLAHTLSIINAQKEERRLNLKLKTLQLSSLRPRLRDRLKNTLLTEHNMEQVDTRLGTWDSYTGYCHLHRFPNNLSDRVKRQLYFLASQTLWDWRPHVATLIKTKDIEARVQSHPVTQPDPSIIQWVIESLSMDGRPPFPEMMLFKSRCFGSFPVVYTQKLTLTQILRLYVAANQPPSVWKDVWKAQIGIISPQIVRDCEAFVAQTEFAGGRIVEALGA